MKFYNQLAVTMEVSLNTGDYDKAMSLIGGYYDDRQVLEKKFEDGSGVVIYSAAIEALNEKDKVYEMKPSYAGFLFNTQKKYNVKAPDGNKTRLVVEDKLGNKQVTIELLNYDSDGDEKYDTVTTLENYSYVYFEIPRGIIDNISEIIFIDREDKLYRSVSDLSLSYSEPFFSDVDKFVKAYNSNTPKDELETIGKEFEAINEAYKMNNPKPIYNKAVMDATIFVLLYFVWIYILGDFLVGRRFIWHGMVWCYKKIKLKVDQHKAKKAGEKPEPEYDPNKAVVATVNTLLRFELNVPKDYNGNVTINYHSENREINLLFTKDNGYKQSMAVPSGTYVNAWLECAGYETINLPKTLEVKGYKMTVNVTLKKSDKKLENDEKQIIDNKTEAKDENRN